MIASGPEAEVMEPHGGLEVVNGKLDHLFRLVPDNSPA